MGFYDKRRKRKRKKHYFNSWDLSEGLPSEVNGETVVAWKQVGQKKYGKRISDDDSAKVPYIPIIERTKRYKPSKLEKKITRLWRAIHMPLYNFLFKQKNKK